MKPIYTFQKRLAEALRIRNMKPVELYEKTGISESLLSKYLSGSAVARQKKLTLLADALNVNEVWLMGYDVPMDREIENDISKSTVYSIPILGTIKAGYNYLAQENWIGTIKLEKTALENNGDYFALKIKGDSMTPIFFEGDIVIVKRQNDCENNEFAVVIINGDEATLKKIKKTDNGIILQPLNPSYSPVLYTKEEIETLPIIIVGVVKKLEREF